MNRVTRAAVLVTATALTLAACATAPDDEPTADPTAGGEETPVEEVDYTACMISDEGGWDDASFNESAYEGLLRARDELGVEIKDAESADPSQYTTNVDAMVQEGCDLVIGVGFALEDAIQAGAEANTDINFGLVDSAFSDASFAPVTYDNAKPILFNTHEAAFLAGYMAAGHSASGKVATYGGQPFPSVTIFMDGFYDGVMRYNEDNGTEVEVLGWDKAAQNGSMTGNFTDKDLGQDTTEQFIAQGADVILPVAGPVGEGSLNAASEVEGVSVIWVDSDGYLKPANADYKDLILTSVLKQLGNAVFDTISEAVDGNFDPAPYVGTLENDGVGLAPLHDFESAVDAELVAKVDELKAQIVSGELVVESQSATPTE